MLHDILPLFYKDPILNSWDTCVIAGDTSYMMSCDSDVGYYYNYTNGNCSGDAAGSYVVNDFLPVTSVCSG